ncbi:MAG TPA: ABC transporter substrate-binding protein [Candidatus Dormibacteraeota bacterium]|nr:ABC transporter substrate-binding protein [Candidatus Dormibacteraeota bacterium]
MNTTEAGPGFRLRLATAAAAAVIALTACGSTGPAAGSTTAPPPTANLKPLTSIGPGEGQLNLIAWEGYTDTSWVKPFTAATGCKVNAKFAGSSAEMVTLMAGGGGGQYDMVSASGDADLRLIYGGDVRPMNPDLIPDFNNFQDYFKAPAYNTINGIHYGISLQWGPNVLLYSTKKFPVAPTSWGVLYDPAYKGVITVPDNPIQIADAALYLKSTQPNLGITDPYELTQKQFDATIALLKQQKPLIKKYWDLAGTEIQLFTSNEVVAGAAWPYQTNTLQAARVAVADTIPTEGATGWGDTWMLATNAPHPNCAYMWTKWVSTPLVQAEQALFFGETPVNKLACAQMERLQAHSCAQYHADALGSYFDSIKFWKTPIATCDDGSKNCIDYSQWQSAWTTVTAG